MYIFCRVSQNTKTRLLKALVTGIDDHGLSKQYLDSLGQILTFQLLYILFLHTCRQKLAKVKSYLDCIHITQPCCLGIVQLVLITYSKQFIELVADTVLSLQSFCILRNARLMISLEYGSLRNKEGTTTRVQSWRKLCENFRSAYFIVLLCLS